MRATPGTDLARVLRTLGHLRPGQPFHRAQRLLVQGALRRLPAIAERSAIAVPDGAGWPESARSIEGRLAAPADLEALGSGRFDLIGERRELGRPVRWEAPGAGRLWRFELHYWRWALGLLVHPDRERSRAVAVDLLRSWLAHASPGRGDAWHPYVVATRAWVLCQVHDVLLAGTTIAADLRHSLGVHERVLRLTLERDIGGNHLVRDWKALVGLAVFRGDDGATALAARELGRVVACQVLDDGGHEERSPSYHAQVLVDVLDVVDLLQARGDEAAELAELADRMRRWLDVVLLADGDVPLLNDAHLLGEALVDLLCPARTGGGPTVQHLEQSGLVRVRLGPFDAVLDVGLPCPPHLPAHAHADTLTFELCFRGERLIVDSGASSYDDLCTRAVERSTAAHNTVVVDDVDSTEVWSTFRAGRLARPLVELVQEEAGAVAVSASHDGYRWLPGSPRHRRTWTFRGEELTLLDEVDGAGHHRLSSFLHVAPGAAVSSVGAGVVAVGPLLVDADGADVLVHAPGSTPLAWAATGFGHREAGAVVEVRFDAALPARVLVRLRVAGR